MKLYTEEQLVMAMSIAVYNKYEKYIEVLDLLTPIELPSDEEIAIKSINPIENCYSYKWAFQKGAKWMKDKILNQSK